MLYRRKPIFPSAESTPFIKRARCRRGSELLNQKQSTMRGTTVPRHHKKWGKVMYVSKKKNKKTKINTFLPLSRYLSLSLRPIACAGPSRTLSVQRKHTEMNNGNTRKRTTETHGNRTETTRKCRAHGTSCVAGSPEMTLFLGL